jgi:hypothetical protein
MFLINKTYNFNTKAPAILGSSIKNAKLLATMDYHTAITYDTVDAKFRSVYPALPPGTPDQPEACIYYRFLTESGEKIIIADQWVDESSIETVTHISLQVTFSRLSTPDIARIRDAINALGYTEYNIRQI